MKLLEVNNLSTSFYTSRGIVPAVSNVSFSAEEGKVLAIIGESGSGKSVTALSILQLIAYPGRIIGGEILFQGENLLDKSKKEIRSFRGRDISMIFQEPMTSLNPSMSCGSQIREALKLHTNTDRRQQNERIIELFQLTGIPDPRRRMKDYPHQLSGGMRQRVMIAMALACQPKLLIADEPTTALDVTIQAQILDLLSEIKKKMNMSIIIITHDFSVVKQLADEVIVMYTGKVLESGPVGEILNYPLHPYTQGLLQSIPSLEESKNSKGELYCIKGTVPSLLELPTGCPFHPRCEKAKDICRVKLPQYYCIQKNRTVKCWLYERRFKQNA